MPNTSNDDVIIVGSLSDKELRDSIDKLVDYVGKQTHNMASNFVVAINTMKGAMKDFAITQKVSVETMQDAWKQMSASFDAMLKAQQNATSSGNNSGAGGANAAQEGTIGWLREQSRLQSQIVDQQKIGTAEKQKEVDKHAAINSQLKEELKSTKQIQQETAKRTLKNVLSLPQNELKEAEYRLKVLLNTAAAYGTRKAGILSEEQWHKLNNAIAKTRQQIDKLQEKKPKSLKDVLGMDESSLDAIAKKMAALKKVTVDPQNTAQVKQLGDEYQRLSKLQTSLLGKNAQVIRSNNYLAQSFGYIRNRLVYALTLGAISNFTKELYQIRGQYELLERSLGVLLDDMGKGSQIFRELNAMSLKSPFTLIDLAGAAKQLTAYNFAADEVVDTTRRLADISAALGVPMERLVYNLGQIRAQNVLNARDARDFANAGLPIVSMLADMYTEQKRFGDEMVTTANVYDMMSKKMVSYADVLQVINKVTDEGGKFFDFQAKQADTLQVQMANLNLAYNNMLNSIGKENQGVLAGGLSIVKDLLLNWRQVYRVLMTLITTYGAYRTAVALVGWEHKRTFGARMLISIQQWVNGIKNAKTAMQALNAAMSSNVLGLFVSALAAAVSYFWLFNNSADEMKEKLKEIQETFTSMRSNATDIFVSGLKSDNVNTQIDKLKELVGFAESELGITIPVNIQDVDAENVAQKLRDAKNYIDEYLDFAQAFSETATGNKYLNEYFTEFGNTAQSTFTNIYSSVNTVIEGLQKLADEGRASARDLEILEELVTGKKEDESKLEYLQRLVSLYEELGLIGRKVVTPVVSYTHSTEDNREFLEEQQKKTLDRIKVHNKQVFATMLQDVQDFYSNANIAEYQLERTVKELAERIDINSIPEEQRTLKLSAAINEEASKNNWNDFAKQYARQVANTKFGTTIEISDESKKNTEVELKEWQKKLQSWADANGIALGITLNFNTTEVDAANEALQNVKKAQELLAVQQRKLKVGTATQADVDAAKKALENARLVATQAGSDLASLNRKGGSGGSKKDDVLDVLKDEISLVKKLQSEYDKLTKSGVKSADAIVAMQDAYGSTLRLLNKDLQKFGLPRLELSNILGKNPHEILTVFTELRNILESKGLSNLERMKAVEGVIEELKVSAKTYDMKKVTDGLNSELGKIKDEYELAIELDANPELGSIFADMMGIDEEQLKTLPRTFNQVVARLQTGIDELFKKENVKGSFDLTQMLDKGEFDNWVTERGNTLKDDFVKELNNIREFANKVRLNETKETTKSWSELIDKYGQLQYRLVKIAKDATKEMKNIVNKFGNDEQKQLALDLANKISISQDPSEIARLQEQLRQLLNQVTQGNEQAVNINAAVQNQQKQLTSKAYWDDFKNSDYYTMMFEDMSRNSTRAIQLIIDKMNELKNKVKEDPASMKALSKALQDAQKELEGRSSTVTIISALNEMREAYDEVTSAKKKLAGADQEVLDAQKNLDEAEDGSAEDLANAIERVARAREKQEEATRDAANAETKYRAASKKLQGGMETLSNELQNVQSIFGAVAKLFAAAGDDETAEAINAISEGFSIMTTIIMGVVAAMVLLESTVPWLLAVAAALSVIVGLVSWLSGNDDKQIEKDIKKSEIAVKRLENSYKNLERAVQEAYGASQIAARKAAVANKELQLVELQRQLQLEKSKSSKKRDAGRIADLEGQIIDLKNELKDLRNDITNSFLGISSVSDAVGSMMDDIVDALRNGEDAMQGFNDSIDDMIANMIKQVFSARILGPMLEKIWQNIDDEIQQRGEGWDDWLAETQNAYDHIVTNTGDTGNGYYFFKNEQGGWAYTNNAFRALMTDAYKDYQMITYEEWKAMMEDYIKQASEGLKAATTPTMNDIHRYAGDLREVSPELEAYMDDLEAILREMGLIKDATSEKALSKLQQGIQGVTEDTAGAIEAYMNIVAQRVFEQNMYLQEIRDHLNNFDLDVQLGTLSQMLLQLQQSYQVQQNIESILTGVLNPSGRAIVVELNS